jgi:Tfp pilus assembly protein PilO
MASQMNLRPSERRLLVVVGLVVFVVVNIWFVWPHFGELGNVQLQQSNAQKKLDVYLQEIARQPVVAAQVKQLESAGSNVPREDQAIELLRAIQQKASLHKVSITGQSRQNTRTNQFFLEQSVNVSTLSGESELVNFLHDLGSAASTIRVRDLSVSPEPQRHKLTAKIQLVSSYQAKAPAAPAKPAPPQTAQTSTPRP